jgi:DNA sulfur modification protein DndE
MVFNRIYVGEEVDQRLRLLKTRTGLTPNLLCRLGFCLSLTEPIVPDPELYAEGQAREFNRYTLTGQWDMFFFAMLKERRLTQDGSDPEADLEANFKAHLSRGINMLYQRLERLEDLANIIAEAQQRMKDKYPNLEMEAFNASA